MKDIQPVFLQEFKIYLANNYALDCKYGYGWLLEKNSIIEKLWAENKITEEEYSKVNNNYEELIYIIDSVLKNKEKLNECCQSCIFA